MQCILVHPLTVSAVFLPSVFCMCLLLFPVSSHAVFIQALRNARQFEVRKVCRRIRAQEEKCAEAAGKDAAAAAALHKGLAKLSGQREALKVHNCLAPLMSLEECLVCKLTDK